jgi:hypothetical protein
VHLAPEQWPIVIQNRYPAYIPWETFLANQAQLVANRSQYEADKHGVPRQGQALLQGILRCGRCGALMSLHYSGVHSEFPVYRCNCAHSEYGTECYRKPYGPYRYRRLWRHGKLIARYEGKATLEEYRAWQAQKTSPSSPATPED